MFEEHTQKKTRSLFFDRFQNRSFLQHQNRRGRSLSVSKTKTHFGKPKKKKRKRPHSKSSAAPSFQTQSKRRTGLRPFKATERANSSSQRLKTRRTLAQSPREETNGRNPSRTLESLFWEHFILRVQFGSRVGSWVAVTQSFRLYTLRKYL